MPLVSTSSIVASAIARSRGAAAFNVVQLENLEAVLAAGARCRLPVIVQISENAARYHGGLAPLTLASLAAARATDAVVSIHLDHAESFDLVLEAVDLGVSSVMFDASAHSFSDNVAATARAVTTCHAAGVWVEAELGEVGGKSGAHAPGVRTDPKEGVAFVEATGVDALAVAVGSSHKMVARVAELDFALIEALASALPVPLVLHGSSGVSDDNVRLAIAAGITKVNVATQLNKVFTSAVREYLSAQPTEVDPRRYLGAGRAAMTDEAERLLVVISGSPPGKARDDGS
jgi:fructose-bisphosphate aldolase class II